MKTPLSHAFGGLIGNALDKESVNDPVEVLIVRDFARRLVGIIEQGGRVRTSDELVREIASNPIKRNGFTVWRTHSTRFDPVDPGSAGYLDAIRDVLSTHDDYDTSTVRMSRGRAAQLYGDIEKGATKKKEAEETPNAKAFDAKWRWGENFRTSSSLLGKKESKEEGAGAGRFRSNIARLPVHHIKAAEIDDIIISRGFDDNIKAMVKHAGDKNGWSTDARDHYEKHMEGAGISYDQESKSLFVPIPIPRRMGGSNHSAIHEFAYSLESPLEVAGQWDGWNDISRRGAKETFAG